MNKTLILRRMAGGLLLAGLSACSTIKSWFPDKERDYQFTSEIPELIVPDDLKSKGLAGLPSPPAAPVMSESADEPSYADTGEAEAAQTATPATTEASAAKMADEAVEEQAPAAVASGGSSLQIDQAKTPATRMVGRALTRQKVEIVERNVEKGYFYVKYDAYAVKARDESIWDELNFMFGDDPSQEQEYRITVHGLSSQLSEVSVQDSAGKTLSNDTANALLKLITEGINQVMNQNEADDAAADANQTTPESEQTAPANPEIRE